MIYLKDDKFVIGALIIGFQTLQWAYCLATCRPQYGNVLLKFSSPHIEEIGAEIA
jgi:hypothetical protein